MCQMCEIIETRSILKTRIRQWMTGTAERICAKFTRKTCLVLRLDEFECQGQRSRSPGTKNVLCTQNTPAMCMEWNALVADNVAQAAGAMIQLLLRAVFAGICVQCLAGYRRALPHSSSFT